MASAGPGLRDAFEHAQALPPAEREEWIRTHVPDPHRRAQLHAMLLQSEQPSSLFDQSAAALVAHFDAYHEDPAQLVGARLGEFHLDAVAGEGGSSLVFRAHRQIGDGRQVVALKLLRSGLSTPDAQRRFRREQGLLTRLNHPNLATLIDGGLDPSGIPYIAMEWVDGVSITEHDRQHDLSIRARVSLLLAVCGAVDAAHRALIVHRDLKPSNVLVTRDGQPKVLDFGIALLLDEYGTVAPHPEDRALSPGYAAPEQYGADPISLATDVYALGVMLAELVSGRRWSELTGHPLRDGDNQASRTGGRRGRPLQGDLGRIVAMATAGLPEHRYRSAGALGDELQRYLERRPIAARPPSALYALARLVQRHAWASAMFAIAVATLIGAFIAVLSESKEAHEQAQRALVVRDFLVGVFDSARQESPREQRPTADVLVRRASERIRANPDLGPGTRFDLLRTLGEVSVANGDYADAERLYGDAAEAGRALFPVGHPELVDVDLLRATLLLRLTRYGDAADAYEALLPQMLQADTAAKAEALVNYPSALMFSARVEQALAIAPEAALRAARFHGPDTPKGIAARVMPPSMLVAAGRFRESIPLFESLMSHWRDGSLPPSPAYVEAIRGLATARAVTGDVAGAEALRQEGVEVARRIYEPPHDWLARALLDRGRDLVLLHERLDEAEPMLHEALAMFESVYGPDHLRVVNAREALADLALGRHEPGRALAHLQPAQAWCEQPERPPTRTCLAAHQKLADAFLGMGRLDEATRHNRTAYAMASSLFEQDNLNLPKLLNQRAAIDLGQGRTDAALASCDEALAMLARMQLEQGDTHAASRFLRARVLEAQGRHAEALADLESALEARRRLLPDGRLRLSEMLMLKAIVAAGLGRHADAREAAARVRALAAPAAQLSPELRARFEGVLAGL